MKQIHSGLTFLNMAGKYSNQTVRLVAHMIDAIDSDILQEAVQAAQQRFPYLCVRLCMVVDSHGAEHYAYEDNPLPWILTRGQRQVQLLDNASNNHLIAFAYWDDCIALDFFYSIADGTGAYRVLRTLLYEYCCRRYDAGLSREGIMVKGDNIDESEYCDPAALPKPAISIPKPVSAMPQALNLYAEAVAPMRENGKEVVHIRVDEEKLMQQIRQCGASPASWFSLMLARSVKRLHPDGAAPTVSLAVNLRKGTGTPLTHQPMVGVVMLPLRQEMLDWDMKKQVAEFRRMIAEQASPERLLSYYWAIQDGMKQLEQVPSAETRHELVTQMHQQNRQKASFSVSYVGRAALGDAGRYVREIQTEANTPLALLVEISAAGGAFCISFIQQFAADVYLDSFLDELCRQGIDYDIVSRHPISVAPIADFRNDSERISL